jgi:sulfite exporter TauE/SafE/copper chaperone CopZ
MAKQNKKQDLQTCELYVDGMHCAACEVLIEKKLRKVDGVEFVDARLSSGRVIVKGHTDKSAQELAEEFTTLVEKDGYTLHTEKQSKKRVNWMDFAYALPISLTVILIYIILQKTGLISADITDRNYPAIVFIGFVASLSSCMAVTGGLVLSLSASYAKELKPGSRIKAQIMFHLSRLIGFFVLGGVIGFLGQEISTVKITSFLLALFIGVISYGLIKTEDLKKKFLLSLALSIGLFLVLSTTLNEIWAQFALSALTGTIMVILGLNLLEIFEFTRRLQFKMPKAFSHTVLKSENVNSRFTPLLLGVATFFLPCGFTQSVQTYALGTKSVEIGSLTMLAFALGTLPILGLISFASVNFSKSLQSGVFFKIAGILVLFFALVNIIGALTAVGLAPQILNFK